MGKYIHMRHSNNNSSFKSRIGDDEYKIFHFLVDSILWCVGGLKLIKSLRMLILVIIIFFMAGCVTQRGIQSDDPLKYSETVAGYIDRYGSGYVVEHEIKSGTPYEVMTWPSKGIRIRAVMQTGDVVLVERFNPNSGHVSY